MTIPDRFWARLSRIVAACGVLLILIGAAGYVLGWNDAGGVRYHSNIVPLCLFAGMGVLCLAAATASTRAKTVFKEPSPTMVVGVLALISWTVVLLHAKRVVPIIGVRADVVMGSESQFIDHIIRFRAGEPQYTPPDDANTSAYTPGAPLLTYFIASAVRHPTSIPVYRLVQQLYLLLAVIFASLAARDLFRVTHPGRPRSDVWLLLWIPFLYLISNNPHTNVYTHVLYSDALALSAEAVSFWLLVRHHTTGDDRWLVAMAAMPAIGFLAKQKQAIWAGLYLIYLVLSGRTSFRRVAAFSVAAFGLLGITVGICYAAWGAPFYFWTFEALSRLHVSVREVLEQILESGWYTSLGLVGGLLVLRGELTRKLLPLWICWVVETLAGMYTSGIAFRPAHLGPATLVGAVWFLVGLSALWPAAPGEHATPDGATSWWRTATLAAVLGIFASSGVVRISGSPPGRLERYLRDIEKEFNGLPRDRVLLDTGSWVYLPGNVVMKDRESPLGTLWGSGTGDFAAPTERIRQRYYQKIMLRKAGPGQYQFRVPRMYEALLENYRQVRVIPSPGIPDGWLYPPLLYDVSVYQPIEPRKSALASQDRQAANRLADEATIPGRPQHRP